MSFRSVFIAVVIAFALILAAFRLNRARPKVETEQPSAELVQATGKCAECHARTQYSVVHQYEMSAHVGAVGFVPNPRRIHRELRFQSRRSCRQWILQSLGMGTGRCQRDCGGIPSRPAHDASLAAIHRSVCGGARSGSGSRIMGLLSPRGWKSSRSIGSHVRQPHLRCSSDGSAAIS
jgi:hypothetical protein